MKPTHQQNKPLATRAIATLEYAVLITIVLASFLMAQKYIVRGFAGRWKDVGDTFGYGRQYDPRETTECLWSEEASVWYEKNCFEGNIDSARTTCYNSCVNNGSLGSCGGTTPCGTDGCCRDLGHGLIICIPACYTCCYQACELHCAMAVANSCPGDGNVCTAP